MPLDQTQRTQALSWITNRRPSCLICRDSNPPILDTIFAATTPVIPSPGIDIIMATCSKCGHTDQFAAKIMGVDIK